MENVEASLEASFRALATGWQPNVILSCFQENPFLFSNGLSFFFAEIAGC